MDVLLLKNGQSLRVSVVLVQSDFTGSLLLVMHQTFLPRVWNPHKQTFSKSLVAQLFSGMPTCVVPNPDEGRVTKHISGNKHIREDFGVFH